MAKGYNATEYMYSSAQLRAKECAIATSEQLFRMADADSVASVAALLPDFGFDVKYNAAGELMREETLMSVLSAGFLDVSKTESAEAIEFLRYRYDCNNIKVLIKCGAGGISPDSMLLPIGTVEPEAAKAAFADKDYSAYPAAMQAAIAAAEESFAATGDPQTVDFTIDRACFADMLAAAKAGGMPLAEKLVRTNIDLLNIMITLRLMRMRLGVRAEGLLDRVYLEGGTLEKSGFLSVVGGDESSFAELLRYGAYSAMAELIDSSASLGVLEKKSDDLLMLVAKEAKFLPFGAEVAVGYIMALEYEVKNIRIIIAGKSTGLSAETIRERLRENYV